MVHRFAQFWFLALVVLALQGCPATNPVREAQTLDQKGYALYGMFVVFEEQAASLKLQGVLSESAQDKIREIDGKAKPLADKLLDALTEVSTIRRALEKGESTQEKLQIAVANLDQWILNAEPEITALINFVEKN